MPQYLPQSAIFLPKHPYLFQDTKYEIKKIERFNEYASYPMNMFVGAISALLSILLLPILFPILKLCIKFNIKLNWYNSPDLFFTKFGIFIQETFFEPAPDDWDMCLSFITENIFEVYDYIKLSNKPVIIYGYEDLTEEEHLALENFKSRGWEFQYIKLDAFYLFFEYFKSRNLKVGCSAIVVLTRNHFEICRRFGFQHQININTNLLCWSPDQSEDKYASTSYTLLGNTSVFNPYIQGKSISGFERKTIIILSVDDRPFLNDYLLENYAEFQEKASKKGFEILHFPTFKKLNLDSFSTVFLKYFYPEWNLLSSNDILSILNLVNSKSEKVLYNMLINKGNLPLLEGSFTLRVLSSFREVATFSTLRIPDEDDKEVLDLFFEKYFKQLTHVPAIHYYSLRKENLDGEKEKEELELKFREIFESNKLSYSLGVLIKILGEIKIEDEVLDHKIKLLLQNSKLFTENEVTSSIFVDKNYRILFPDFGNIELKIPTLSKVVYIFFLKHPEGIILKDIYLHKVELRKIYMRISSRSDEAEMEKSLDDLIDPLSGSLNQKISRIQHNLKLIMSEFLNEKYRITGSKGAIYKIGISRELIQFSEENNSDTLK